MLRFTNQINKSNFHFKNINNGAYTVLLLKAPTRGNKKLTSHCDPPVSSPRPKYRKFLWATVGVAVATGVAVAFTANSVESRNWIASNFPIADKFMAIVLQENSTYLQTAVDVVQKAKQSTSSLFFGTEDVTPPCMDSRATGDLEADAKKFFEPKSYPLPPLQLAPLYREMKKMPEAPDVDYDAVIIQTEKCDKPPVEVVNVTKGVAEAEQAMFEFTKQAINHYKAALKHSEAYIKTLFAIVEAPVDGMEQRMFTSLFHSNEERNKEAAIAAESASKARASIDTIECMLKNQKIEAPADRLVQTTRFVTEFRNDIAKAEKEYKDMCDKINIYDHYKKKVLDARKAYQDELKCLFPDLDLNARTIEFKGDIDLFLIYTLKQVARLQKEIAEIQTTRDVKLAKALECDDKDLLIDLKVEDMLKKEALHHETEFLKKSLQIEAEYRKKLDYNMERQVKAQEQKQQYLLASKEKEAMSKFQRILSEKMQEDRTKFKKELAALYGKLRALEQTLKSRAAAESEAKKSQALWAAAESLLAATRKNTLDTQVNRELDALQKIGKSDRMVMTVLKGIPKETKEKGIATEMTIRNNFDQLEKTVKKIALVGKEGASLPVYFLSWLQSKLLIPLQAYAQIPEKELENFPIDFTELDTFDIMQRARYHMDRGDIADTIRYVNLLQGAPRIAAKCWLESARRHLEIRQAAEAIMAHASISGMLYL